MTCLKKQLLLTLVCLFCTLPARAAVDNGKYALSYSWHEFTLRWEERHELLAEGNFEAADQQLKQILTMKELSSWDDLFAFSRALQTEAAYQEKNGKIERAGLYYRLAAALAPHDMNALLRLANFQFIHHPGDPAGYFKPLLSACALPWHDWLQHQLFHGNLLVFGLWALIIFGGCFLLLAFCRHFKALSHDYGHLFPAGTPAILVNITLILLLCLPPLFQLGPFWYLLLYGAFIWWALNRFERLFYSCYLLIMIIITLLLPSLVAPIGALAGPRPSLYQAAMDPAADPAFNPLLAKEVNSRQSDPDKSFSPEELYILGLRAVKSGALPGLNMAASYQQGKKYLDLASRHPSQIVNSINALGILQAIQNEPALAAKEFAQALKARPSHLEANFNLARYHYSVAAAQEAQKYMHQANSINNQRSVLLNDIANKYGYSFYAYAPFRFSDFGRADSLEQYYNKQFLAAQVWEKLGKGSRSIFVFGTIGLWLLLFALTSFLKYKPSRRCPRCGRVICPTCYPQLSEQKQCLECYNAEVSRFLSEEEKAQAKRATTKGISYFRYQQYRKQIMNILTIIIPPGTLFLNGRRRACAYLLLYALAITNLLLALGLFSLPFVISGLSNILLISLAALLWLVCLIAGLNGRGLESKE